MDKLSDIGPRGLVIYTKDNTQDKFYYVKEVDWRSKKLKSAPPIIPNVKSVVAELRQKPRQVFIDLDQLAGLQGVGKTGSISGADALSDGPAIILHEGTNYFSIPQKDWSDLPTNLSQADSKVLVTRGAVVAVMPPNDLPVGAYCVLINLSGLN